MEIGTGLTTLGVALGGKDIIVKLLGPTADYIGGGLASLTEKAVNNIVNIFENANQKIGDKIDEPGGVPPKVLKSIINDGAWCEEKLQVEYFGGVLASSRTPISRDDRGAYFTSLVSRLSTYQLRAHYLFYHLIKMLYDKQSVNINVGNKWNELQTFIPIDTVLCAMDFSENEIKQFNSFISHILFGLDKEDLITGFRCGNKESIIKDFKQVDTSGLLFNPTKIGVELFMWAYGYGQYDVNEFFNHNFKFANKQDIKIGEAISTKQLTNTLNSSNIG